MALPSLVLGPGDFYADRRILGLLGSGGMGVVYRVEHPRLVPRQRALKVLHPGVWLPPRWEVGVGQRLGQHPNVVQTLSAGHDAATGTYFHEMELLEGQTLEQRVRACGALCPAEALALLEGVAAALDTAHSRGLVHCDLKPSNLLAGSDGVLKVLDFGIAEALWERQGNVRRGTPAYMAPEQLSGAPVLPQTDLWALGLVSHFLLTGAHYWSARDAATLRAEILAPPAAPLPLRSVPRAARPAYESWLLRCLQHAPERRPASASEALLGLRQALAESGVELHAVWPAPGQGGDEPEQAVPATAVLVRTAEPPASPHGGLAAAEVAGPAQLSAPELQDAPLATSQDWLVCRFFPRATDLVRVADDLITTSTHYLLRPPADHAALDKQLSWFAVGVNAYNRARAAYEEQRGDYARMLASSFGSLDDALHAAARHALACSNAFELAYAPPAATADVAVAVQHAALCVTWQGARMALSSCVRQARRALDRLEERVEAEARRGALELTSSDGAASAARLLQLYAEQAHALADNISERFLAADFADPAQVTARLWEMAPHITALNEAFVKLSEHSLSLRVSLLRGADREWRAEHKLASALKQRAEFQWERYAPALNAVLVPVISLLLGEPEPHWLAPVVAQRPQWAGLVQLLRSLDTPRP